MRKPLYGLVIGIPSQMEIINAHCFKSCGKIIVGGINDEMTGGLMVCRTPKEECPRIDKEMDTAYGEVMGDPIFIRKLK